MKTKQTDFPELEGSITLLRTVDNCIVICRVVGCCFDVGITIVEMKNPEKEYLCLNYKYHKEDSFYYSTYENQFYEIINGIKNCLVDRSQYPSPSGALVCAFSE